MIDMGEAYDLAPVLLYGGSRANEVIVLPTSALARGSWNEYELGQVFWTYPDGTMRLIWVGRPPGDKPPIKLSLDVAVLVMRLLCGWT